MPSSHCFLVAKVVFYNDIIAPAACLRKSMPINIFQPLSKPNFIVSTHSTAFLGFLDLPTNRKSMCCHVLFAYFKFVYCCNFVYQCA